MPDELKEEPKPFRIFETEDDFAEFLEAEQTKARRSGERRGKKLSEAERSELEELRSKHEELEDQRLAEASEWKKLSERQTEKHQKEVSTLRQQLDVLHKNLKHDRCHLALVRAATPLAYNPEQVARLLSDRLTLNDDGEAVVLDEHGDPTELTPKDLVEQYLSLEMNANLVRAGSANGGSGAKGSSGSKSAGRIDELRAQMNEIKEQAAKSPRPLEFAGRLRTLKRELETLQQAQ